MLRLIASYFGDLHTIFNLFNYITFRSGAALVTSFMIFLCFGSSFIKFLKTFQLKGQPIRASGPKSHIQSKKNTPTMGGIMIIFSIIASLFLFADLSNRYLQISVGALLLFGTIGALDDYIKLKHHSSDGISAKLKFALQIVCAIFLVLCIEGSSPDAMYRKLTVPCLKDLVLDLGVFYSVFAVIVIIGASNAVNLTDGLDGLAILSIIIAFSCFAIIGYVVGNVIFSEYLHFFYLHGVGELAVVCSSVVGAGLGFLWYNAKPAQMFMGDVGSLALGGLLGTISVITKQELLLAIIGGIFVIEALSVIIQVGSFKLRKKRVFKMAPIHHHFEKMGLSETKIVIRFCIVAIMFALFGLATLKVR